MIPCAISCAKLPSWLRFRCPWICDQSSKIPLPWPTLQELKIDQDYADTSYDVRTVNNTNNVVNTNANTNIDEQTATTTTITTAASTAIASVSYINLPGRLKSFGCGRTDFLPRIDNLTHLDLSSQNFYSHSAELPSRKNSKNSKFIKTFEEGRTNEVTDFTITVIQKYQFTITRVIVPTLPVFDKLQQEFIASLVACPLLREVVLPVVWKSPIDNNNNTGDIRQDFVNQLRRLRPDIQLRCL